MLNYINKLLDRMIEWMENDRGQEKMIIMFLTSIIILAAGTGIMILAMLVVLFMRL